MSFTSLEKVVRQTLEGENDGVSALHRRFDGVFCGAEKNAQNVKVHH